MVWGKRLQERIGPFRVLSLLNRGGMAEIYKVVDDRENLYALKMSRVTRDPERSRYFNEAIKKEAAHLARLNHPRIVRVFPIPARGRHTTRRTYSARCVSCPGQPWYMILEYLDGGTLEKFVKQNGPLTVFEATNILGNIALGVNYLHAHNIVHKDLSMRNILFRTPPPRGGPFDPVIIDLGTIEGMLKRERHEAGTLQFMAPEQLRGLEAHRAPETRNHDLSKVDIWALGVLLYFLLTSRLPFDAPRRRSLTSRILYEEPEPIRALNNEVDEALEHFVLYRMLAKDPKMRPTVRDVLCFLKPYGSRRWAPQK